MSILSCLQKTTQCLKNNPVKTITAIEVTGITLLCLAILGALKIIPRVNTLTIVLLCGSGALPIGFVSVIAIALIRKKCQKPSFSEEEGHKYIDLGRFRSIKDPLDIHTQQTAANILKLGWNKVVCANTMIILAEDNNFYTYQYTAYLFPTDDEKDKVVISFTYDQASDLFYLTNSDFVKDTSFNGSSTINGCFNRFFAKEVQEKDSSHPALSSEFKMDFVGNTANSEHHYSYKYKKK